MMNGWEVRVKDQNEPYEEYWEVTFPELRLLLICPSDWSHSPSRAAEISSIIATYSYSYLKHVGRVYLGSWIQSRGNWGQRRNNGRLCPYVIDRMRSRILNGIVQSQCITFEWEYSKNEKNTYRKDIVYRNDGLLAIRRFLTSARLNCRIQMQILKWLSVGKSYSYTWASRFSSGIWSSWPVEGWIGLFTAEWRWWFTADEWEEVGEDDVWSFRQNTWRGLACKN